MKITPEIEKNIFEIALQEPLIGRAFSDMPELNSWSQEPEKFISISNYHFLEKKNGFELPFDMQKALWCPKFIELDIHPKANKKGWYKKGVKEYCQKIKEQKEIAPVIFVFGSDFKWRLQDGNHRYEAHLKLKKEKIKATFVIDLRYFNL